MKSYLIAFLVGFSVLMTGCGYSFETDETLEAYLEVVAKMERSSYIIHDATISRISQAEELLRRKPVYQPLSKAAREVLRTVEEFNT